MTQKIKDLISFNEHATLVRGVQLDWYGSTQQETENARLTTGYIFSSGGRRRESASAIHIFESIRDSLNIPNSLNAFTVVAQYGHGKSHFALVLANFFGRSDGDPLLEKLITQIELCSDPNTAAHFRSFKRNAGKPQLVVRLSGIDFTDLRQGFLKALRRALSEHDATRDYPIKAVSVEAARWLRSLTEEQRARAEQFLDERYQTDVDALIQALENFDISKENVARELSRAVVGGWEVNFGAEVNLRDIIDQVVKDLCVGPDAPFYKMVILFDELGVYAEKWCHNRMNAGGLAPQQLTEACDNNRGRLCLVGFIQRDITGFAKGGALEEDFAKWAKRFPEETTLKLEANLEQVIRGLLPKNQEAWGTFARDNMPRITDESDTAWAILPNYQRSPNVWTQSKFVNVVGVGGFPLHPLTTGLLCNLDFTQGPRTIIGAVSFAVHEVMDESPVKSGKLNWIRPTFLVDYFEDSFEGKHEHYSLYANAVKHLGNNSPPILYEVLKALFLFYVGGLIRYTSQSHATVLSQVCGLPDEEVRGALKELDEEYSVIRFSQASKEYQFSGIGTNRVEIRQQLIREIAGRTVPSLAASLEEFKMLARVPPPSSEAIEFMAAHAIQGDEWCLAPRLIDAAKLSYENVKNLVEQTRDEGAARGIIIYVVSEDGVALDEAREEATSILDKFRFGENPQPIVIAIPQTSAIGIEQEVLVDQALKGWGHAKRELYGEAYDDAVKDSDRRLEDHFRAHVSSGEVRFHLSSVVESHLKASETNRLDRIADRLFEEAFPHRPPAKSHIMKVGNLQGNTTVAEVSRSLITNDLDLPKLNQSTQNLVKAVLHEGQDRWGILNIRNRIQEPANELVLKAWREIGGAVHEDRPVTFDSLINRLRNIPFGYDDYTLTLLLAAWIGKNKNELSFTGSLETRTIRVRPLSAADLQGQLKKAREFVKWLSEGRVQVQQTGKGKKKRANEYLKQIEDVTDCAKATQLLTKSDEIIAGVSPDDEVIARLTDAIDKLKAEVARIQEYQSKVQRTRQVAERTESVFDLLSLVEQFPQNPATFLTTDETTAVTTKQLVERRIESLVEKRTQQGLRRIESYEALYRDVENLAARLQKAGREDLKEKCLLALDRIKQEYESLKAHEKHEQVIAKFEAVEVKNAPLVSCRELSKAIENVLTGELGTATEKARHRVEKVLKAVQSRITAYDQWLEKLPQDLSSFSDLQEARQLFYEIIGHEPGYAGAPELESLEPYKQGLEERIRVLEEAEKQQAAREATASAHLSLVNDRANRILEADSLYDGVRELPGLMELERSAADVQLNDSERQQVSKLVKDARDAISTQFEALANVPQPNNEREFERQIKQLQRVLTLLSSTQDLPAEWHDRLFKKLDSVTRDFESWRLARNKDIVNRITDDFSKLKTAEQRRACLLRLTEICQTEGLSSENVDRIRDLLDLKGD
jgi:hypothetical protein